MPVDYYFTHIIKMKRVKCLLNEKRFVTHILIGMNSKEKVSKAYKNTFNIQ